MDAHCFYFSEQDGYVVGGWILALACAFMALAAFPAQAGDACGPGHMRNVEMRDGALVLRWEGRISQRMAADIGAEFDRHKRMARTVTLALTSCGGHGPYMDAAITELGFIKATHPLTTLIDRGALCSSACVPIFLAGNRRVGALASLWFFHPAGRRVQQGIGITTRELSPEYTESIITRYFVPAGVSADWIQFMRRTIRDGDLWQTGRDLWESKSGILTETLDNVESREEGPVDLPSSLACGLVCRG